MTTPHRSHLTALRCIALLFGLISSSLSAAVVSGTYTGDGTAGRAVNIGFQPDVVIIQRADTQMRMQIRVTGMSETKDVAVTSNGTNRITALTSTGFTVSSDGSGSGANATDVNGSGVAYEYLAISQVAGEVKVGSYTGDGTDNRSITGLGFQPDMVWALRLGQPSAWRTNLMSGDVTTFWTAANISNGIQALQTDGFQVGTDASVNASAQAYWFIACKNVAGKFKTGTHTGTGGP